MYPDQATMLTTKGFSLCRGHFRRRGSLGSSWKTRYKSSVRCARGADTLVNTKTANFGSRLDLPK